MSLLQYPYFDLLRLGDKFNYVPLIKTNTTERGKTRCASRHQEMTMYDEENTHLTIYNEEDQYLAIYNEGVAIYNTKGSGN